jgi:hypothetical protein
MQTSLHRRKLNDGKIAFENLAEAPLLSRMRYSCALDAMVAQELALGSLAVPRLWCATGI